MTPLTALFPRVVTFDNLLLAWRKARKGKASRADVARFSLDLETELVALRDSLRGGAYIPGPYQQFTIYERKPRTISVAPFRDRIVHHAVMNVLEPPMDARFHARSYACRKGRGVHAAVRRYQRWAQRYAYVLKMDVQRYFPSIDHMHLKRILRRHIADERLLALLDGIIDASPTDPAGPPSYFPGDDLLTPIERGVGIPIGNLTSQFFANLYLDDLDHRITGEFGVPSYLRYVDDLVLLADEKKRLWETRACIADALEKLRLRPHPNKSHVTPTRIGIDMLGYRVKPHRRRLRNDNGHRFSRRMRRLARAYACGRVDLPAVRDSIAAWVGHASHAETEALRERLLSGIVFSRGAGH